MLCLGFFYLGIAAAISDMSISASASGDETTDTDTLVSSAVGVNMALTGVAFCLVWLLVDCCPRGAVLP
jgi:hypothetical protein